MKRNPYSLLLLTGIIILTSVTYAQENNYITSKYDFIPGEKVIFFDDFSAESIGDFPAQWLTNGSGEIVTSGKFPGRWFQLTKEGYFIPEAREDFTENYTIEFDFVPMNIINSKTIVGIEFFLLSGSLDDPGHGGQPGQAGMKITPDAEDVSWANWSEARNWEGDKGSVSYVFNPTEEYHISIWVQKQRVRFYANETKFLDVPRGLQTGYKYNIFRIETSDDANPIISNFRIAAGLSDMRNKLLKDGKIISYGIHFDVNSDKLKPESYSTLKVIADILKENPTINLQIVGHTDSDGDEASNLDLSKRRAVSVKNELANKFGIAPERLSIDGKGESEPLAANDSAVNKAKNRRVEFINFKNTSATVTPAKSSSAQETGTFKDSRDGKIYKTVKIGTQIWMAENLAYKAASGCWAYDNNESNVTTYGYLYNWETATKACPSGWHLPSDAEWTTLTKYLGGDSIAHDKLKESGPTHWKSPDPTVNNESGFTGLPGGRYSVSLSGNNSFKYIGDFGHWWSSSEQNSLNAGFRILTEYYKNEAMDYNTKSAGFSVRCIRD
jgi:uncharacterized protein (TIGR02145 family)